MTESGTYADGRTYPLPPGWVPTPGPVLDAALRAALGALDETAFDRVRAFYDPAGPHAGDFLTAEDGYSGGVGPHDVDPSDVFAVGALGVHLSPLATRSLLRSNPTRSQVQRSLANVPNGLPITVLDDPVNTGGRVLEALKSTHDTICGADGADGDTWVFASHLLARKRPGLSPALDPHVRSLLRPGQGQQADGGFAEDLQVHAFLMTELTVTARLVEIRRILGQQGAGRHLEDADLRLLSTALRTAVPTH